MSARAPLLELFASIQGEGAHVGEPQLFLRLAGCPLRCAWCDTPHSWPASPRGGARIEQPDGELRVEALSSAPQAACFVRALDQGRGRTLSVTGGEPLLWPDFLEELADELPDRRLHLETAGAHPETLARVADRFQHLSVDLKLPADMAPPVPLDATARAVEERSPDGEREWADVRRRILPVLRGRDACAKLVIAGGRAPAEFLPLLDDMQRLAPDVLLILQPATPVRAVPAPAAEAIDGLCALAAQRHLRVRVLPQVHRLLGLQ